MSFSGRQVRTLQKNVLNISHANNVVFYSPADPRVIEAEMLYVEIILNIVLVHDDH